MRAPIIADHGSRRLPRNFAPFAAAMLTLAILPSCDRGGFPSWLKARRIIAASRAAYATCATYEDNGTSETTFRSDAGHTETTRFRTAFAGAGAVRFAYADLATEHHSEWLTQLIADDTGVRVVKSWTGESRGEGSLNRAVGVMTGVSHGLSTAILPLLPSQIRGTRDALDVENPRFVGMEDVEGQPCDVIEGVHRSERVRVWIARQDSLIRRMTRDRVLSEEELRSRLARVPERLRTVPSECDAAVDPDTAVEGGLSTYQDTRLHPHCGGSIEPGALRQSVDTL